MQDDSEIPLEQVTAPTFEIILEFLQHHDFTHPEPILKPIQSDKMEDLCTDKWDAEFINKFDDDVLLQLISAANYMDIRGLLDICCARVATYFKGKNMEKIMSEFAITEEFTPEMEENIC